MDRRTRYTQQVIKETFIHLISEKEINKITVSEICKIADINRATFYRYYLDVYDLLSKIEEEFVKELKKAAKESEEEYTISSFTKKLLSIFLDHKDLVKILFSAKNNINFLDEILEISYISFKKQWKDQLPDISEENIEYATIYVFNGALGIINYWIQNDFDKEIDEIATFIENISYYGTRKFIYQK